jgi:hypothetical protein
MQLNPEINNLPFDLPKNKSNVIKVIGVGGGGSNAINHMFKQGIKGVDFVICNTDSQALNNSGVPIKIQLGVKACESVLHITKSTPFIPCLNMWLIALLPPPPTPITLITLLLFFGKSNGKLFISGFNCIILIYSALSKKFFILSVN